MSQAAIVIPIYKSNFDRYEKAALKACNNILHKHPIRLVGSKSMNYQPVLNILNKPKDVEIIHFHKSYFKSVKAYSKLLLSKTFYQKLKHYNYILIYQTDAFVFKDELEYWCKQNYDYIGAPWISGDDKKPVPDGVGNGGFSLRKTETMLKVLNTPYFKQFIYKPANDKLYKVCRQSMKNHYKNRKWLRYALKLLHLKDYYFVISSLPILKKNPFYLSRIAVFQEDIFWSKLAKLFYPNMQIPDTQTALRFSFELNAKKCYALNNNKLPFGCHAWMKYNNEEFWKHYIGSLQ